MTVFKKVDLSLLLPAIFISLLGLLIIFSIIPQALLNQLVFIVLGVGIYFFLTKLDFKVFKGLFLLFLILSVIMLLATLVLGQVTRGSVRWIKLGTLSFQASEFIKPLLIISFSGFGVNLNLKKILHVLFFCLVFFVPAFLVFSQPDLGNTLVLFAIWIIIALNSGLKKIYAIIGFLFFLLLIPIGISFLKPYQINRLVSFVNPEYDPLGSGYNLIQSTIAVGSGSIAGKGLGMGSQSHLEFLPERHTDFIFASFAEELGFLGSSLILILYFTLLLRIIVIAEKTDDKFGHLLCLGVFMMIFFQAVINIGMNLGILPITGITLPLFSVGGSSYLTTFISLGLVQQVSSQIKEKNIFEIK